jgi:AraC-like DNA-binding protein
MRSASSPTDAGALLDLLEDGAPGRVGEGRERVCVSHDLRKFILTFSRPVNRDAMMARMASVGPIAEVTMVRGAARVRRWFARLPDARIRLDQQMRHAGAGTGLDVTGPYWMVATVSLTRGRLAYVRGRELVPAPARRYGVFLPPFSIVECRLDRVHAGTRAVAGRGSLLPDLPREPVAFELSGAALPGSLDEISGLLGTRAALIPIGRAQAPSPLSHRVKVLIDEGFADLPPLSVLAASLHTSPAVMSRYFSRDYGLPPVRYRHAIRVMDALMRLVGGEAVADVAASAGFSDLGQFYRQFGLLALAPPGRYRVRSRNPKNRRHAR